MKKNIIAMSVVTALATTSFAADANKEMLNQIQALKAQIEALEKKVAQQEAKQQTQTPTVTVDEKRIEKIEKKLDTVSNTATAAKIQSGNDNLKWDVDFRTQVDNIQYKHADGSKSENNALLRSEEHTSELQSQR